MICEFLRRNTLDAIEGGTGIDAVSGPAGRHSGPMVRVFEEGGRGQILPQWLLNSAWMVTEVVHSYPFLLPLFLESY